MTGGSHVFLLLRSTSSTGYQICDPYLASSSILGWFIPNLWYRALQKPTPTLSEFLLRSFGGGLVRERR